MPGLGRKAFAAGDVLTAADLQGYAVDQSIMVFGGTAARGSAISSPSEGMFTYLSDSNTLQYFNGTSWVDSYSATNGAAVTNRNLLYNGAMQVAQRGTSTASITTAGYYTADRWYMNFNNTVGTWTQSVEADYPSGSGLFRSLKMLCTTAKASLAGSDFVSVEQRLEGYDLQRVAKGTASAQQLTLSFWVKSNVTGTYTVLLYDADNTRGVSAAYTVSASATWERKTITFPADTTGVFDVDANASLFVRWWLGAGTDRTSGTLATTWASYTAANAAVGQTNLAAATNNYWQVTGVQLEVGPVATSFEFKSYGQELRECQRYYYLHVDGTDKWFANSVMYSTTMCRAYVQFPVTMRTTPNLVAASGTNYYGNYRNNDVDQFNSLTISDANSRGGVVYNSSEISGTAGHAGNLYALNAASSVAFSAEL